MWLPPVLMCCMLACIVGGSITLTPVVWSDLRHLMTGVSVRSGSRVNKDWHGGFPRVSFHSLSLGHCSPISSHDLDGLCIAAMARRKNSIFNMVFIFGFGFDIYLPRFVAD